MKKLAFALFALIIALPLAAQNTESFSYIDPEIIEAWINRARVWFEEGLEYYNNGEPDQAIEIFSEALGWDQDNASAWYYRGRAYHDKGELDLAIKDYMKAALLTPDDATLWYNRGLACYAKGDLDWAIENYSFAIRWDPNYYDAYIGRGLAYYDQHNYWDAIRDYDKAIEINPNDYLAYYYRGNAYRSDRLLNRVYQDLIIADYSRAIELNPDYVQAWNNRGNVYSSIPKREYDLAINDYDQAIALDPEYAEVWFNRGNAYHSKREYDLAIYDYSQTIALNPNDYSVWYERGEAYYAIGEYDLAIGDYSQYMVLYTRRQADTSALFQRGRAYSLKGDLELAIEDFSRYIAINPDNAQVWLWRGITYHDKGDLDLAIDDYSKVIELNPDDNIIYYARGDIYYQRGYHDLAIKDFSKSIALYDKNAWAWNARGIAYLDKGDYDWAIENFSQAIALESDDARYWLYRGKAFHSESEYDLAIRDFNKGIDLDPEDPWTYYTFRGNTYHSKGENDLAIEDYTQAIALNQNYTDAWNNRGKAYIAIRDWAAAISDYTQAIAIDPVYIEAWNNRGIAYGDIGDYDTAIADYNQAIALNPEYIEAWINRGMAYYNKGELDLAIADYNHAISINPEKSVAWNNRGNAYSAKGELDLAIADFSRAIKLEPKNASALNDRGNAYISKDEFDLAIADCTEAIKVNPDFVYAWINLGEAYRKRGDPDLAIENLNKAIELDSGNAAALNNRGLAYIVAGKLDLAIVDFDRAIAINPNGHLALKNRGDAYRLKGETDLALADYRLSIESAETSTSVIDIFYNSWEFAGYFYDTYPFLDDRIDEDVFTMQLAGLTGEALGYSIARAETARSDKGSRGTGVMTGLIYQYYAGVDFEASFGSVENAFAYSERLRSRGFLEQMGVEEALKLPGIDPEDAHKVRTLIREIENLQLLLSTMDPQREWAKHSDTSSALTIAEESLAVLEAKISKRVTRYAELRYPKPADLYDAQYFCGDDMAILEYVLWDSSVEFRAPASGYGQSTYQDRPSINSYCLVITGEGATAVRLDPDFDFTAIVEALRSKLLRVRVGFPPDEITFEYERNALYNALIKPVQDYIPENIKNILIVPDGNLAFLPFDILREKASDPNLLGERFSITLSPSISCSIIAWQKEVANTEPVLAFGGAWYEPVAENNSPTILAMMDTENRLTDLDERLIALRGAALEGPKEKTLAANFFGTDWSYLGGTVAEIQGLERISTATPTIIEGKDVTKRNIKRLSLEGTLLDYPIIHFALHGYFEDNLIPQAALVFSEVSGIIDNANNKEDGYLSIEDIALLQLNARMVMLSACQTGLGQIKRGDGMSGLARAFMTAGAQNVGVSLWKISDDATAEFMWGVYRKVIREGKTFRDAYSEVKEEFRKSERWKHPYYWAGFTMYE